MNFRFFLLIPLCLALCGCTSAYPDELSLEEVSEDFSEDTDEISAEENASEAEDDAAIYVYVCGRVNVPGVYQLPADSRRYQALSLAGGLADGADVTAVNQAETCHDGEMIYVPAVGENIESSVDPDSPGVSDGRVNINTADSSELQKLKGIGASRAQDIISYREKNGDFRDIESIMNVPGIKQGTFDKIKDQIKV